MNKIYPCIIGLGYVGLPLFLKLSKKFKSIGFDKNNSRIKSLIRGEDYNNEFNKKSINFQKKSKVTSSSKLLNKCNFFIIAVPTPVNKKFQTKEGHKKRCPIKYPLKKVSQLYNNLLNLTEIFHT